MATKFRSVYNSKRVRVGHSFIAPEGEEMNERYFDRTKQHFAPQCDVNSIVRQHPNLDPENISNSEIASILSNPELYSEYDSSQSFVDAMEIVTRAKEQFDTLPAPLRRRFNENPYEFLEYVNNKENYNEMKKFGLLIEKVPDTNILDKAANPSEPVTQPKEPAVAQTPPASEPSA